MSMFLLLLLIFQVNKMVFVVLVAFVICWTPFQALVLVYSLNHNAAIHGAVSIDVFYYF